MATKSKDGKVQIKDVEYVLFSVEKFAEGGWAKKDLADSLKQKGIRYSFHRDYAYSPFVGQFGILIEDAKADEAEKLIWG